MNDQILVLSPEKVVLTYRSCGLASRIGAHLLDLVAAGIAAMVVATLASLTAPVLGETAALVIGSLGSSLTILGYFVFQEGLFQGQTLGKRAVRARVVMHDGTPVTFAAALYRNLLRPADFLPFMYLAGLISVFLNTRSQRLGDITAGTVVIVERAPSLDYVPAPHHVGIHRMESTVGDLAHMSIEEYHALKRLVDRFTTLPLETQQWSVETIWKPFCDLHKIEPAAGVHPIKQMEAVVMKFGRLHKLV